jgi:hypothetical protein
MSESIYPSLKTNQQVNDMINQNINKQRAQKIVDKIKELERQLEHYRKVSDRWKNSGKVIRITNLALTGIVSGAVATLAVLSTIGIAIPIVVTAVLGGYAVIQSSTLEGMNVGMIKRKNHKYKEKCNIIQSHIYKMNFYYEKARQDGVIVSGRKHRPRVALMRKRVLPHCVGPANTTVVGCLKKNWDIFCRHAARFISATERA